MKAVRQTPALRLIMAMALSGGAVAHAQQVTTIDFTNLPFPNGMIITDEFSAEGILFSDDDTGMDADFPCPSLNGQEHHVNSGTLFNLYRLDFITEDPVVDVVVTFRDHNIGDQIHGLYELDEDRQIVQAVFFDDTDGPSEFTLQLSNPNGIASIAACELPLGAEALLSITFTTMGNQPPDCATAAVDPSLIWPPDHSLVPILIEGVSDPDGDPVILTLTGIHQDEPLTRRGIPDAAGIGTSTAVIRAARAGRGDGRVYHLSFEAQDDNGGTCTGTVKVCVPHDQRPGAACGDGGALFNSTGQ